MTNQEFNTLAYWLAILIAIAFILVTLRLLAAALPESALAPISHPSPTPSGSVYPFNSVPTTCRQTR